ncbi:hypothetical protein SAMD00019534_016080 [Acytostelium subglobosum LB1]|uniref:hypothetical protein n=1 Tax=Acytostelium subglobosum LB1 TaxID=1410327 RepID=UPI000644A5D2|nr:hypothetical protein SAMD00019534_016080 [Acytostelium subglobosum LB1]GAM18433.1 hypothetical protein SAMD00019534_016080 [Acytostelium subglobosum LB1]|eukprot:XP_012757653.1 hypothetical protein SAMD00019534_016080 [Acytostelium subglobosum LB1]
MNIVKDGSFQLVPMDDGTQTQSVLYGGIVNSGVILLRMSDFYLGEKGLTVVGGQVGLISSLMKLVDIKASTSISKNSIIGIYQFSSWQMFHPLSINDTSSIQILDSEFVSKEGGTLSMSGKAEMEVLGNSTLVVYQSALSMKDTTKMTFESPLQFNITHVPDNYNMIVDSDVSISMDATMYLNHSFIFLAAKTFSLIILLSSANNVVGGDATIFIYNSTLGILSDPATLIQKGNSRLVIFGYSTFLVTGIYIVQDTVKVSGTDLAAIDVVGTYIQKGKSQLVMNNGDFTMLRGNVTFGDQSTATFYNGSNLNVNGTLLFANQSILTMLDSEIQLPGDITIQSTVNITKTLITIQGTFTSNGNTTCKGCNIELWGGSFNSFGNGTYSNSKINVTGNANFGGSFIGSSNNISVNEGNLSVFKGSSFNCANCNITIEKGHFVYDTNSVIILTNSSLSNINGNVLSNGDVLVYPGSAISNNGVFSLNANILKSANVSNNVVFSNTGNFTTSNITTKLQQIMIPMTNSGQVSVSSVLGVVEFKQLGGNLNITNGVIQSYQPVVVKGGYVNGRNGNINASLENSGTLGLDPSIYNTIQLAIQGNLTQINGSIIIIINSLDDFSQINVTEIASFDGEIIIKINENFTPSDNTSVNIVNFGSTQGNFTNVKVKSFDPNTKKESDPSCNYQVGHGQKSLSVLVSAGCGGSSKNERFLSIGAIVGIVIAAAVVAIVVISLIVLRTQIRHSYKLKSGIFKLRSIRGD